MKEKTIEQRLHTYALHQDKSIDKHMPRTSKKQFVAVCLLSPVLALFSWVLLIYFAIASD